MGFYPEIKILVDFLKELGIEFEGELGPEIKLQIYFKIIKLFNIEINVAHARVIYQIYST